MSTETRTEVREIPAENMERLEERVAELNKRARRLKVPELRIEVVGESIVERETKYRPKVKYNATLKHVVIIGESPVLSGWELIARLTPAEGVEGENFVKTVPGKECPDEFRTVDMKRCDHCNTRRNRNDTFVVCKDSEFKVVGRNCIADFLGNESPDAMLNRAECLFSAEDLLGEADSEFWGCGDRREMAFPIELFVAMTAIFIRRFGWVPRSKANEFKEATADSVWTFLIPPKTDSERKALEKFTRRNNLDVTDDDMEVARKALKWIRSIDRAKAADYMYNLSLACASEVVKWKQSGLVASVISAYNRHVEELVKIKREKAKNPVHLGEIKSRYVFPNCTVRRVRSFDGHYGVTTLVVLETPGLNTILWWASGDKVEDFPVGDEVTITGTVKAHDEYKDIPQTVLSRCVVGRSGKAKDIDESAYAAGSDDAVEEPAGEPETAVEAPVKEEPTENTDPDACRCGGVYRFREYCGAQVCLSCNSHKGLARCYCGWSAGGGDGRRELVEMGETIDPEDY